MSSSRLFTARARLFRPPPTVSTFSLTDQLRLRRTTDMMKTARHVSQIRHASYRSRDTRPRYRRQTSQGPAPFRWQRTSQGSGTFGSIPQGKRRVWYLQLRYWIGGATLCFFGYNMERVPVTNRWRFNCVPNSFLEREGEEAYQESLQQMGRSLLPDGTPEVQRVRRVLQRLIPFADVPGATKQPWTVNVVHSREVNAFVMPGRHVFVYTGLLKLAQDDDALATVIGHEIAHNVANHSAEKLSTGYILVLVSLAISIFFDIAGQLSRPVLDIAINKPGSRAQETEADYLGLLMMAKACYDPQQALPFWMRMAKASQASGNQPPQFLSTHPSDANRINRLQTWMPEAIAARNQSGCTETGAWMNEFGSFARHF